VVCLSLCYGCCSIGLNPIALTNAGVSTPYFTWTTATGHHGNDATATRRALQESSRRQEQAHPVFISQLFPWLPPAALEQVAGGARNSGTYQRRPHKDPEICTSRNPIFEMTIGLCLSPIRSSAHEISFISTVLVPFFLQTRRFRFAGGTKVEMKSFIVLGSRSTGATERQCVRLRLLAGCRRSRGLSLVVSIYQTATYYSMLRCING
jgi:hypothetical protein